MSGALSKAAAVKYPKSVADYGDTIYDSTDAAAALADAAAFGIPLLSESISSSITRDEENIISGRAAQYKGDITGIDCGGDITTAVTYSDLDLFWCSALGFENPDYSPATEDTSYYRHVYEVDPNLHISSWLLDADRTPGGWDTDDMKVRSFLFGMSKDQSDHWINGAMINSMTFNFGLTDSNVVFNVTGHSNDRADLTNASWQEIANQRRAVFPQAEVKLGSTDGSTFAETAICISALSITLNNNMKTDDRSTCEDSQEYIMEPVRNGFTEITGSITLPRYTSDSILDMFDAGQSMHLKLVYTNGYYELGFYLPLIVFSEEDHTTNGPELRQEQFSFRAFKPPALTDTENPFYDTTGAWFSDLGGIPIIKNGPLVIITKNTLSSNVLLLDHA